MSQAIYRQMADRGSIFATALIGMLPLAFYRATTTITITSTDDPVQLIASYAAL